MSTKPITLFDITTDESATSYSHTDRELALFMLAAKEDTHSIDLAPFDISRDKNELWAEHRQRLGREFRRNSASAGGVMLTGYTAVTGVQYVRTTPLLDLISVDGLVKFWHQFGTVVWNEASAAIGGVAAFFFGVLHLIGFLNIRERALAPRASEILAKDTRRPILMIRSFVDDEAPIFKLATRTERDKDGKSKAKTVIESSRFEEAVAPEISKYGPLIAVGNPREDLPQLGAARARFSNETWKEPVLQMLDQSRVILLVSGIKPGTPQQHTDALKRGDLLSVLDLTPGVRWEVERILGSPLQDKLLVLFKPTKLSSAEKAKIESGLSLIGDFMEALFTPERDDELLHLEDMVGLQLLRTGEVVLVQAKKKLDTKEDYELGIRILVHNMLCYLKPAAAVKPAS